MEDQPRVCATMTTCPCGRGEFYCYWGEKTKTQTWLILNFRGKDPRSPNNVVLLLKITRTEREKEHWEFLKTAPPVPPPPPWGAAGSWCAAAPGDQIQIRRSSSHWRKLNKMNSSCCFMHSGTKPCIFFCLEAGRKSQAFLLRMRRTTDVNKG